MGYLIRVETIATPIPTAIVRRRAALRDLPKVVPEACGIVWNLAKARHVQGAGRHVALYLDEQINLEVGVEVAAPIGGDEELIASSLPAGRVATTTHFGPYQLLGQAHVAIRDWCAKNGHALAVVNWEVYGHWEDAWNKDPSKIRTDVYYLLK
jgi:effector-binding domain-containing protein